MWFIQIELLNKYCEMLGCNFLVTDFDILFKLLNYVTLYSYTFHRFNVCPKTVDYETIHKYT